MSLINNMYKSMGNKSILVWLYTCWRCWLVMIFIIQCTTQSLAQCVEQQKLNASDATQEDFFGISVSVSGNAVIVGSALDDCSAGQACGSAYIYRSNETGWFEEQKITAFDAGAGDNFGVSVSISGDTAIVGAPGDNCVLGSLCGSAYVYRFIGSVWIEQQKITASDAEQLDQFGFSISLSGDIAVVGAPFDDCAVGNDCGAVYVYRFNGTSFVEEQKLTVSDAGGGDQFGYSVSTSGSTVVIGSNRDDCAAGNNCGSAYLFRFNGASWVEQQKLTASDAGAFDEFGLSVSVSGDVVVIGAVFDDEACPKSQFCNSGSVYVFRLNGTSWEEQQKLTANDAAAGDLFGYSVSVDGGNVLVGAPVDHCSTGARCGTAYVFQFNGVSWLEGRKLVATDSRANDFLGNSVSVSGDTAMVGTPLDSCDAGIGCGSVYLFEIDQPCLTCGNANIDLGEECDGGFGCSDCLCDLGYESTIPPSIDCQATCGDGNVVPEEKCDGGLGCSNCRCEFGYEPTFPVSVDCQPICGNQDLVPGEECDGGLACTDCLCNSGFVPTIPPSVNCQPICGNGNLDQGEECDSGLACTDCLCDLSFEPTIPPSVDCQAICGNGFLDDTEECDGINDSACPGLCKKNCSCIPFCGDDTCDPDEDKCSCHTDCGIPSLSELPDLTCNDNVDNDCDGLIDANDPECPFAVCIEQQKLTASDAAHVVRLGSSISISEDTFIVGAGSSNCASRDCSWAYVYRFNGATWVEEQKLTASDVDPNTLGVSVSLSGDTAIIGERLHICTTFNTRCGAAYVFRFNGTSWVEQQKLTPSDADGDAWFGHSVSLNGDTAVIGATALRPIAAYVFRFNGNIWVEEQKLIPSNAYRGSSFGNSVSVNGDTAVVGAPYDDLVPGVRSGSAFVFRFNGTTWIEEQKLIASDASDGDRFGWSVSISGDTIFVGASVDDIGTGAVYVYRYNGSSWSEVQKLTASDATRNSFGDSVSISGDKAIVGAFLDACEAGSLCGAAYTYRFNGTMWLEEQKLTASDASASSLFGASVSISAETAVVGASASDCAAGLNCGSAYVFRCLPEGTCADAVTFLKPQRGSVDARQPSVLNNPLSEQGINTILVEGTRGTEVMDCWTICETSDTSFTNVITAIDSHGNGRYTMHLARPISPGGVTTVTSALEDGSVVSAQYTSHPGNVNGDTIADENDISRLLDSLSGAVTPPLDQFSTDIDHSGKASPADILRLIDLLNGADGYDVWMYTPRPDCGECCPR